MLTYDADHDFLQRSHLKQIPGQQAQVLLLNLLQEFPQNTLLVRKIAIESVKSMVADLKKTYESQLNSQGISLNDLEEVINNYEKASLKFHERLDKIDKTQ